jgi:hypothetical protein
MLRIDSLPEAGLCSDSGGLLVASSMDGSVTVVDGAMGHLVAAIRPHKK